MKNKEDLIFTLRNIDQIIGTAEQDILRSPAKIRQNALTIKELYELHALYLAQLRDIEAAEKKPAPKKAPAKKSTEE